MPRIVKPNVPMSDGRTGGHQTRGSSRFKGMDDGSMREALALAQASERVGRFEPSDWPDLAVALLLAGVEDEEVAELAGFDRAVNAG
jgi:hypothetical protein